MHSINIKPNCIQSISNYNVFITKTRIFSNSLLPSTLVYQNENSPPVTGMIGHVHLAKVQANLVQEHVYFVYSRRGCTSSLHFIGCLSMSEPIIMINQYPSPGSQTYNAEGCSKVGVSTSGWGRGGVLKSSPHTGKL